jgi:hypothetical protein
VKLFLRQVRTEITGKNPLIEVSSLKKKLS